MKMSFEVPPVSSTSVPAAQPVERTDKPQAANGKEVDAVQLDMIPSSPPAELHDQIDAAAKRVDDLQAEGRELHFSYNEESKRVQIQVKDLNGNVLRTIPPSKALSVATGDTLD
jgi:flagellar protein FlaG